MDNASKALIIAGSILLAVLIISLGVAIFTNLSGSAKEAANMDEQEISNFNSKISPYVGKNVNGSQVNALIQLVISINNSSINSEEFGRTISITYPMESGGNNTIKVENKTLKGTGNSKRVKTGAGITYNVTTEYSSSGLINKITVN